jgi:hypothetical protein
LLDIGSLALLRSAAEQDDELVAVLRQVEFG